MSIDGGETWKEGGAESLMPYWSSITSSADGTKLVATDWDGYIYIFSNNLPEATGVVIEMANQ
ncbi:hypothetical protein SDC9_21748 [bioreactor metagenome]|uniref:Uncharacterized protein n=1 Tax=bioreactor metagenome TaxID=1076179 RepID=A0A644UAK9_9ZZZZ|nr:hypothetical protein [Candidatus Elulimicrobiales bacterium]